MEVIILSFLSRVFIHLPHCPKAGDAQPADGSDQMGGSLRGAAALAQLPDFSSLFSLDIHGWYQLQLSELFAALHWQLAGAVGL